MRSPDGSSADDFLLTLLLVRHGQTEYNAKNRLQGHLDIPLSNIGIAQAHQLADGLSRSLGTRFPFPQAVYTSDLSRAIDTAAIIMSSLPPLPTFALPILRERNYGSWEGLTAEEIKATGLTAPRDAEDDAAVWQRMQTALETLYDESRQANRQTLLIVGHGGSLRAILIRALGGTAEMMPRFSLDNACLSVVEFAGQTLAESKGRLLRVNDTVRQPEPAPDQSSTVNI